MSTDYGQFCGLAKAAGVLGEQWAMLVLRDLLVSPKNSEQLSENLPVVDPVIIDERLTDFVQFGLIEAIPDTGMTDPAYRPTDYARSIEPALDSLARWGARRMGTPSASDVSSNALLASALRCGYREGVVLGPITYAVKTGSVAAWATVTSTDIEVGEGTPEFADLTITAGAEFRGILAGRITAAEAIESELVGLEGPFELFRQFTWIFNVPLDDDVSAPGAAADQESGLPVLV